jgi:hypothetical protein
MDKPILSVDFDGVIHSYSSGWQGADVVPDPPVPGAIKWLARATDQWDVQIYSSRSSQVGGIDAMRTWLFNFSIHEFGDVDSALKFVAMLSFPTKKPSAFLTIDDRAVCFDGDWSKLDPSELLGFKPWNKRK